MNVYLDAMINLGHYFVLETDISFITTASTLQCQVLVSSRVGVYLDHSAGVLSFYRVSDTMTLLHRVQTTFTQPLYAGVAVGILEPQLSSVNSNRLESLKAVI